MHSPRATMLRRSAGQLGNTIVRRVKSQLHRRAAAGKKGGRALSLVEGRNDGRQGEPQDLNQGLRASNRQQRTGTAGKLCCESGRCRRQQRQHEVWWQGLDDYNPKLGPPWALCTWHGTGELHGGSFWGATQTLHPGKHTEKPGV